MSVLRVILWNQLNLEISSLKNCKKDKDILLLCELMEDATYVKHHKKKLVLLFSAMRHFYQLLIQNGYHVVYVKLDDKQNTQTLQSEVLRIYNNNLLRKESYEKIVFTHPSEYRVLNSIKGIEKAVGISVEVLEDNLFLCSNDEFASWAEGQKSLKMESFYHKMRIKHNILMLTNGKPVGGKWNYDSENRKFPKNNISIPKTYEQKPDLITMEVIDLVDKRFSSHFGDIEPFHFATTRKSALEALKQFIDQRLENFGQYQDAMLEKEEWMYHSHISFYLNCSLLTAKECIEAASLAYKNGKVSLSSVEGFIRQILGWREYIKGVYWLKMPQYKYQNFLKATRSLPEFYWTGNTKMNCIAQCVKSTKQNAYAHHIQRLMVLGNFALICGIDPKQVNEWYLIVYADAFEWVELPNVSGMVLFADGGYLASKPYAASGNYIDKMSDYCKFCQFDVKIKNGSNACPFNYLYWNFLIENKKILSGNRRLGIAYNSINKMQKNKLEEIKKDSEKFLSPK